MKKSTRNADARSKSTTKRPFKSAYAVEKHDENEKVAPPPPPVANSSSANEEEEEEEEGEEILEGFPQDEAKNEETTVCVAKAADDTKEDENENALMEDTKEM